MADSLILFYYDGKVIVIATVTEVYTDRNGILIVRYKPSSPNAIIQIKQFGIAPQLTQIYKEFESKNIIFEIVQEYLGEEVTFLIPREEALKKSGLLPYASQGLNVHEANVYFVIDLLRQLEEGDPPIIIHKHIGFDDCLCFKSVSTFYRHHKKSADLTILLLIRL